VDGRSVLLVGRPSPSASSCDARALAVAGKVGWQLERSSLVYRRSSHKCRGAVSRHASAAIL